MLWMPRGCRGCLAAVLNAVDASSMRWLSRGRRGCWLSDQDWLYALKQAGAPDFDAAGDRLRTRAPSSEWPVAVVLLLLQPGVPHPSDETLAACARTYRGVLLDSIDGTCMSVSRIFSKGEDRRPMRVGLVSPQGRCAAGTSTDQV
jgi:hypothetical protein